MARAKGKDSLASSKQQDRSRRRVVHVFTEGRVTEPSYIDIFEARGFFADQNPVVEVLIVNARAPGSQRKPMDLVDRGDGRPLEPVLIDVESGQRLELTNVRAVAGPGADQGTRDFFSRLTLNRPTSRES